MQKIIMFDLDGTIADTIYDLNAAINYALDKHGFATKNLEQTRKAIGNGLEILVRRCVPDGTNDETVYSCLKDLIDYYSGHYLDKTVPYQGMQNALISLKEKGYVLGVVTNKNQEIATNLVNKLYPNIFRVIQGHEHDLKLKPDVEPLLKALNKLGFKDYLVTYIGDSLVDYKLAKNAQIPAILVSYGYNDKEILEANIKDAPIVDAPQDLLSFF